MCDECNQLVFNNNSMLQELNPILRTEEQKPSKVKQQINEISLQLKAFSTTNNSRDNQNSNQNQSSNTQRIWSEFGFCDTSWNCSRDLWNESQSSQTTPLRPIKKTTYSSCGAPTHPNHCSDQSSNQCSNHWYDNWRDIDLDSSPVKKQVRFEIPSQRSNSSMASKDSNNGRSSKSLEDEDKEESTVEEICNSFPSIRFGASFQLNAEISEPKEQQMPSQGISSNPLVNALLPVLRPSQSELNYGYRQLTRNVETLGSNLNSVFFNDPIWSHDLVPQIINGAQDQVMQIAQKLRNVAKKVEASYTWSGQLPRRLRTKNPIYSCKVFLGGIPYDLTDSDLHCTFAHFGHIQIQWPGKDIKSAIDGATANKAGYVYIIFETYDNVAALLNACTISYRDVDSGCRWYYNISSRRQKGKEVQVIPFDIGDRFYMKGSFSGQMEHNRTVFVGALHGMLTADGLAKVMDDLFSGVIFAGLDTDKHKYPLGSGRVSFDNQDSYLKAVSAAFVEIKSVRFKKKIQIDPYIENESLCAVCKVPQQSPIFCRDLTCFRYFCRNCWDLHHSDAEALNHRPIIKNKASV